MSDERDDLAYFLHDPTEEELANVCTKAMMRVEARRLVLLIRLLTAVERAELSSAIGYLFDLSGYEAEAKRTAGLFAQMNDEASKLRWEIEELKKLNNQLRGEIDTARHDFNKFRQWINEKFTAARKFFVELRDLAKQSRQPLFGKGKKNEPPQQRT